MPPRFGSLVGRLCPASEDPDHAPRLVELDNHVGAFVDGPDVVVFVDAHGVGFGPGVEALANFAQELAFGTELEQLCRRGAIGRTAGAVGAREHENVALGINGHTWNLAEIHPERELEEVRNGIEGNFRHALLSVRERSEQHEKCEQTSFHRGLPASLRIHFHDARAASLPLRCPSVNQWQRRHRMSDLSCRPFPCPENCDLAGRRGNSLSVSDVPLVISNVH